MIQRAKTEGFGHFLGFGLLDRLDIAYSYSSKQSLRCSNGITDVLHLDHSVIMIRCYKMTCFEGFVDFEQTSINKEY